MGFPLIISNARSWSRSATYRVCSTTAIPFGALSVTSSVPPWMNLKLRIFPLPSSLVMKPLLSAASGSPLTLEIKYSFPERLADEAVGSLEIGHRDLRLDGLRSREHGPEAQPLDG